MSLPWNWTSFQRIWVEVQTMTAIKYLVCVASIAAQHFTAARVITKHDRR